MVWPTPDKRATNSSVGGEKVPQFNYMMIGNRLEYDAKAELEFAFWPTSVFTVGGLFCPECESSMTRHTQAPHSTNKKT